MYRNKGTDVYDQKQAQLKADTRRKLATKAIKMTTNLITEIEARIKLDWSPEKVLLWIIPPSRDGATSNI